MSFTFDNVAGALENDLRNVDATIRKALQLAYDRGMQDGAEQMRLAILASATSASKPVGANVDAKPAKPASRSEKPAKRSFNGRAPNGAVGVAVDHVFETTAGLSVMELHRQITRSGVNASTEAVGAHLRRHEGKRYRRDGREWFPLKSKAETAGTVREDDTPAAT